MATLSIILAWEIPQSEETEGYSPRGLGGGAKESITTELLSTSWRMPHQSTCTEAQSDRGRV